MMIDAGKERNSRIGYIRDGSLLRENLNKTEKQVAVLFFGRTSKEKARGFERKTAPLACISFLIVFSMHRSV